eukprot:2692556-Rhodomonas_salina.2
MRDQGDKTQPREWARERARRIDRDHFPLHHLADVLGLVVQGSGGQVVLRVAPVAPALAVERGAPLRVRVAALLVLQRTHTRIQQRARCEHHRADMSLLIDTAVRSASRLVSDSKKVGREGYRRHLPQSTCVVVASVEGKEAAVVRNVSELDVRHKTRNRRLRWRCLRSYTNIRTSGTVDPFRSTLICDTAIE